MSKLNLKEEVKDWFHVGRVAFDVGQRSHLLTLGVDVDQNVESGIVDLVIVRNADELNPKTTNSVIYVLDLKSLLAMLESVDREWEELYIPLPTTTREIDYKLYRTRLLSRRLQHDMKVAKDRLKHVLIHHDLTSNTRTLVTHYYMLASSLDTFTEYLESCYLREESFNSSLEKAIRKVLLRMQMVEEFVKKLDTHSVKKINNHNSK